MSQDFPGTLAQQIGAIRREAATLPERSVYTRVSKAWVPSEEVISHVLNLMGPHKVSINLIAQRASLSHGAATVVFKLLQARGQIHQVPGANRFPLWERVK